MNAEIKRVWVAALRSGEYTQGYYKLRQGDSFCCLGVLCDLHRQLTAAGAWDNDTYNGYLDTLPPSVQYWAGLDSGNPAIFSSSFDRYFGLAQYNDGTFELAIHSFLEIADLIEPDDGL